MHVLMKNFEPTGYCRVTNTLAVKGGRRSRFEPELCVGCPPGLGSLILGGIRASDRKPKRLGVGYRPLGLLHKGWIGHLRRWFM